MSRVVVIGAGLAGLAAALRLAHSDREVVLLNAGIGGLQLSQGTIDVLGYAPECVERPLDAIERLPDGHPYRILGSRTVAEAVEWFASLLPDGWLVGDVDRNMRTPTAVGVARPTALAPPAIAAGRLAGGARLAIVGVRAIKDFQPGIVAANLARLDLGDGPISATAHAVDVTPRDGVDISSVVYARAMDDPSFRHRMGDAIAAVVGDADAVGVPAMVGMRDHLAWPDICERVGRPVFEIPIPPPSVPGMRLNIALTELARAAGVRIIAGGRVVAGTGDGRTLRSVTTDAAGHEHLYEADHFVFAPGGFESGALHVDSYWTVTEPALGLPLTGVPAPDAITDPDYWADQPLFRAGVAVDETMRVIDSGGDPVYDNLVAAGGILAGATRWREKSGEGIAIASAVRAADTIIGASK